MIYFIVLFLGLVACVFLYRFCVQYKNRLLEKRKEYVQKVHHTYKESFIYPKNVNFILLFVAFVSFWISASFTIYLLFQDPEPTDAWILVDSVFCPVGIVCIVYAFYAAKQCIVVSNCNYIIFFHYYKKKETCLLFSDISYYKFMRRFLWLKTKRRLYFIDYNHVNFDALLNKLKQNKIPEKKTIFHTLYR